ncbi:MAG: NUDIX hydrolase [Jatrophihabitans sp.]|uniref:NUDIX hydrolase n=1 Tax=Jatrophihabitans sp. TaxID=1932789 RepID=UPI003F7E6DB4
MATERTRTRSARPVGASGPSRPAVAVDTALLTVADGELQVVQARRPNGKGWALPGSFLEPGERLHDAVARSLADKVGVTGLRPRQLQVLDEPDRDEHEWVLSVAHVDVVALDRLADRDPDDTRLMPVDRPGRLPFGHNEIIRRALDDVRARYAALPDPDGLLPDTFTLRSLRMVHEVVAGSAPQRDTFRRVMEPHLVGTGATAAGSRGRPAELFRRR